MRCAARRSGAWREIGESARAEEHRTHESLEQERDPEGRARGRVRPFFGARVPFAKSAPHEQQRKREGRREGVVQKDGVGGSAKPRREDQEGDRKAGTLHAQGVFLRAANTARRVSSANPAVTARAAAVVGPPVQGVGRCHDRLEAGWLLHEREPGEPRHHVVPARPHLPGDLGLPKIVRGEEISVDLAHHQRQYRGEGEDEDAHPHCRSRARRDLPSRPIQDDALWSLFPIFQVRGLSLPRRKTTAANIHRLLPGGRATTRVFMREGCADAQSSLARVSKPPAAQSACARLRARTGSTTPAYRDSAWAAASPVAARSEWSKEPAFAKRLEQARQHGIPTPDGVVDRTHAAARAATSHRLRHHASIGQSAVGDDAHRDWHRAQDRAARGTPVARSPEHRRELVAIDAHKLRPLRPGASQSAAACVHGDPRARPSRSLNQSPRRLRRQARGPDCRKGRPSRRLGRAPRYAR